MSSREAVLRLDYIGKKEMSENNRKEADLTAEEREHILKLNQRATHIYLQIGRKEEEKAALMHNLAGLHSEAEKYLRDKVAARLGLENHTWQVVGDKVFYDTPEE